MASNPRNLLRITVSAISLAASFLTASSVARAQSITPERALLGRTADARDASGQRQEPSVRAAGERGAIDGERALLNRAVTDDHPDRSATTEATAFRASPDGGRALLNHATL